MNKHQEYLVNTYIDWVNNYATVKYMAEHYEISETCLLAMIEEGKVIHNEK